MPVPAGWVELAPPPFAVDAQGNALSGRDPWKDPDWPVFVRAQLVPQEQYMQQPVPRPLDQFPRWVLYGGPVRASSATGLMSELQVWAWQLKPPYMAPAESVRVSAEDFPRIWVPGAKFGWSWQLEHARPVRRRLAFVAPMTPQWRAA